MQTDEIKSKKASESQMSNAQKIGAANISSKGSILQNTKVEAQHVPVEQQ